ncbi:hypothetical protein PQR57_29365 [Paraburkholderia dipogonis]|uniref:Uncharacterized protein n=1 Tax=Paraburkholderia dipogonis TaxID=1211383 RepID=A0ABW9B064_9BURK
MDTNPITISLEDDSPGYEISPARVPLATLATFAEDVREFLKGSGKDGDADAAEVAVVHGSLAVQSAHFTSPSLVHDLQMLEASSDLGLIDPKRRAVVQRWQSSAYKKPSMKIRIQTRQGTVIAISNQTSFRAESAQRLVNVERYIRGEVVDLGGATQANAHIKLPDGKTLKVRTDRDLIRSETENHLYKQVHLRIRAKLDVETGDLSEAQLVEFVHYSPQFDEAAFARLTAKGDEAWKDVDDPAEWVRHIRGAND